mmetsp:Transcript_4889/g.8492  ORF Transcript_4889/g.8492 Transcript_4889/m.8492 type:complete len:112 (-) Transcript_4889:450-785(-)|eukprot:CAMPEP_0119101976 /NCGR_PEP_ID=MMETSP1180-20130426/862_1 /TAXON_ID=3052 ORGANISM="Chlamydomonas cf sp, Strain CCMP681" /NCGR_SAMPLE_ID=MMETSP1180 /ASSEMBLY_ACC=CAM_ASM_000741 /LENGTH=111 /DNA_ID=CAMNT_0007086173 /DNA_START=76 /DNA_END=411 /DNA_ORIENTATION=+
MAATAMLKYGETSETFRLVEGGRLSISTVQKRFGLKDDIKINGMVVAVRLDGLTWDTYTDGALVQVSGTQTAGDCQRPNDQDPPLTGPPAFLAYLKKFRAPDRSITTKMVG